MRGKKGIQSETGMTLVENLVALHLGHRFLVGLIITFPLMNNF